MDAQQLHGIITLLLDKPHVYGTVMFIAVGAYILLIAYKLQKTEDDSK